MFPHDRFAEGDERRGGVRCRLRAITLWRNRMLMALAYRLNAVQYQTQNQNPAAVVSIIE